MPPTIMGGLPGRAARDVTFALQQAIESSQVQNTPLSGFILDIMKCFNAFPHKAIEKLLTHLGCPCPFAHAWTHCLTRLRRALSFSGDISPAHLSSTGIPGENAVSVAAAIAVCWLLANVLQEYGVAPSLFVDNWSRSSEEAEFNSYA